MTIKKAIQSSVLLGTTALAVVPAASTASAQVSASPERFSPLAAGWLERAETMRAEGNFIGAADQLRHLNEAGMPLSEADAELLAWLQASICFELADPLCVNLLSDFADNYPASPHASQARLNIGDYYFFNHQWPDALLAYRKIDADRLNRDQKPLLLYRTALSMIRTGYFDEAEHLLRQLSEYPDYEEARKFYLAYIEYIRGDFDEAYRGFQSVKPSIPGLNAGYYMTQIEYSRGQYEDVIKHGSSLLRKHPVPELCPEMHRVVGLSYFKTGNPDVARSFLTNYLDLTDSLSASPDAVYALGAIDYADGDYEAAARRFESLTDLEDEIGQGAWLYLGLCHLHDGDSTSAAIAFDRASRMGFDRKVTEAALYNYVTALTRGGKVPFSNSADLLESFVKHYPDSEHAAAVEAYLATAYYNDHEYQKALNHIDAIRNPDQAQLDVKQKVLYQLGIEEASNGHTDEAARHLQQAVDINGGDSSLRAQARLWLGDALYTLGRFKEAENSYNDFIRSAKNSENRALGFYNLAYAKYKNEDYAGAAADFAKAIDARPSLDAQLLNDARIREADCLYYIGKYAEAGKLYSLAIENDALDSDYALMRRALMQGLTGYTEAKLADLNRLVEHYPDSRWLSKALLEMAVTYEALGRNDLAADAYHRRLDIATDVDIDELIRMIRAMHDSGRSSDVLDVASRIRHAGGLEADELAEISLYEADALADLNRWNEAYDIYSDLALTPYSEPGAKANVMLAEAELRHKDFEGARRRMEEFTDVGTPHEYWLARGFIALADAYHGLGKTYLAKEYLSALRQNYPGGNDDIDSMIASRLKKWK